MSGPDPSIDPGGWKLKVSETGGWLLPWVGTMTHGIMHVGEPGAGVWRARSRRRLIHKMAKFAAKSAARGGENPILIEVRDG